MFTVRPSESCITVLEPPATAYVLVDGEDVAREIQATEVEVSESEIIFRIESCDAARFPRRSVLWWMG